MSKRRNQEARIVRRLREMAERGEFIPVDDRVGPPGAVVLQNH